MKYLIKMYLRYIFFVCLILSQQLAWGNADHLAPQQAESHSSSPVSSALQTRDLEKVKKISKKKSLFRGDGTPQSNAQYITSSCIDRCHVNYGTYQTMFQAEPFRHRVHSPKQGLACNLCHKDDYVDNAKTHGNLIIHNKDCVACHHKDASDEDCLKCHPEVKEYMDGRIQNIVTNIPDWMSLDVSCTDCHKPELDGSSFKAVRDYCIECHSPSYGAVYDLWKKVLDDEIKQYCENESSIHNTDECQSQTLVLNISLLAKQVNIVSEYLCNALPVSTQGKDLKGVKNFYKKGYLPLDVTNKLDLVRFVQSYGMHNILLSQMLLKFVGNEQQSLK